MNGYIVGLCIVIFFLATHAVVTRIQLGSMLKVFSAMSDLLGEVSGIPDKEIGELRATWKAKMDGMRTSIGVTMLWWLGITVFLVVLALRGSL
jgi:hypothetical protein